MVWRQVRHIESVAHEELRCRDIDDVGVVVDALEDIEWSISARLELRVSFLRKTFFAEVYPHEVSFLEDHLLLLLVDVVGLTLSVSFKCLSCLLMDALDVATTTRVARCSRIRGRV